MFLETACSPSFLLLLFCLCVKEKLGQRYEILYCDCLLNDQQKRDRISDNA